MLVEKDEGRQHDGGTPRITPDGSTDGVGTIVVVSGADSRLIERTGSRRGEGA